MATYINHGQSTGANDGTSWEDAKQSIHALYGASGDVYIKEHAGIVPSYLIECSNALSIYCGCDSSLTGTDTSPRNGATKFVGTGLGIGCISATNDFSIDLAYFYDFERDAQFPDSSGALRLYTTGKTHVVTNSVFDSCGGYTGSTTQIAGGLLLRDATATVLNCRFTNCYSKYGGAAYNYNGILWLKNCLFKSCFASGYGAAIRQGTTGTLYAIACTFADNDGNGSASMIDSSGGSVYIANSIFYNNTNQVSEISAPSGTNVIYCDVEDLAGSGLNISSPVTTGSVDVDPQFLGGGGDHPYMLSAFTPTSVSQGGNSGVTGYVPYDILNVAHGSPPPMGCYTPPSGWQNINKVQRVSQANLSKFLRTDKSSIAKIFGKGV